MRKVARHHRRRPGVRREVDGAPRDGERRLAAKANGYQRSVLQGVPTRGGNERKTQGLLAKDSL